MEIKLDKKTKRKTNILLSLAWICIAGMLVFMWFDFIVTAILMIVTLLLVTWSHQIKRKAILKIFGLCILTFISSLGFGQEMSAENMRALGIAPRKEISSFITPIYSNFNFFDSTTFFESYRATSYNGNKQNPYKNCTFLFEGDLLVTSLKDPQFSRFRSYGLIKDEDDGTFKIKTYQCKDNSGAEMLIKLVIEKSTNAKLIFFQYHAQTFFEFEINSKPIPEKVFDVLDNIENLGVAYDTNFGENVSDEETKEFLSQFGDPNVILNMMMIELFTMKNKNERRLHFSK